MGETTAALRSNLELVSAGPLTFDLVGRLEEVENLDEEDLEVGCLSELELRNLRMKGAVLLRLAPKEAAKPRSTEAPSALAFASWLYAVDLQLYKEEGGLGGKEFEVGWGLECQGKAVKGGVLLQKVLAGVAGATPNRVFGAAVLMPCVLIP